MLKGGDVDARSQHSLSKENIKFFNDKGFLVIRNLLSTQELSDLRNETSQLVKSMKRSEDDWYNDEIPADWYKNYKAASKDHTPQPSKEDGVPFRIEYPINKGACCKTLCAHPVMLGAIASLIGSDFIPTWDSLVFKAPGKGVPIKWHRDASMESVNDGRPAIDVGIYLDEATVAMDNCLWVIPGTHKWPDAMAASMIDFLCADGFKKNGAIPVPVGPGDAIFHNILVLHGSAACTSPLRRTVYYEYRSIDQELKMGPHKPEYIPLKQQMMEACIWHRNKTPYDKQIDYEGFKYAPENHKDYPHFDGTKELDTYRYPHKKYFRGDYKG